MVYGRKIYTFVGRYGGMKMVVNKENMIDMLNEVINREEDNIHSDDINEMDIYLKGYVTALKNLLFMVSVNGE